MPTTIIEAFAAVALRREEIVSVRWRKPPATSEPGVYIASLTESLDTCDCKLKKPLLAAAEFQRWLDRCPKLTLDGVQPTGQQLMDRIGRFWIPDEVILYIGRATSLSTRLRQYYRTPIGARRPHSGGYFLKLLSNLEQLWVHYVPCNDFEVAEDAMLRRFFENVSENSRRTLHDPVHPFPFANLEWPRGTTKAHGLRKARCEAQSRKSNTTGTLRSRAVVPKLPPVKQNDYTMQPVTAADLHSGQIRIPSRNTSLTRNLFPQRKAPIEVVLRGRRVQGSWDPRLGPDRKRSGLLRIGGVLRELVGEKEVLLVSIGEDGMISID
jgi:hypothetical protein